MLKRIRSLFSKAPEKTVLDFSEIKTREQLSQALDAGLVHASLLFPKAFGGEDTEDNTVFVPHDTIKAQNSIAARLAGLIEQELIDGLRVEPEFKNDSLVPSKIHIQTRKSEQVTDYSPHIDIW